MARTILAAAAAYFALAFSAGCILGAMRVLATTPAIGALASVLIELPIMLVVCWVASRVCLDRFAIRAPRSALATGVIAFALLLIAEVALGLTVFRRSLAQQATAYREPATLVGLAGQVVFALTPLLQTSLARVRGFAAGS